MSFELINEPHTHAEAGNKAGDIGISLADWFACAQAGITSIRTTGATNTIFVPGMAYTAASSFTSNGSSTAWLALSDPQNNIAVTVHCYSGLGSASTSVLRDACSALVTWARTNHGIKINIGEIAIDAGDNGRPTFCSTFATAQAQWADWHRFCVDDSNDVLVGWNWWGNSAPGWWNQGDSCDPEGYHWGLTLDGGATQTIYMDLIETTMAAVNQTPWKRVENYWLGYSVPKNQFYFYYKLVDENTVHQISPGPQEFLALADMFRNEGPINFNTDGSYFMTAAGA